MNSTAPPPPSFSSRPPPTTYAGSKRAHDESFRGPEGSRFQDGARERESTEDSEPNHVYAYKRANGERAFKIAP